MRKFEPSIRIEKIKEPNNFFYIASEGIQTEKIYFDRINDIGISYKFIHFPRPRNEEGHSSPKNVFKTLKTNLEKKGLDPKNDECWIIVDRDSWNSNLAEAIILCTSHNYKYAVSSACIEIWFIMHLINLADLYPKIHNTLIQNPTFKILKKNTEIKKNFSEAYLDFLIKCHISKNSHYRKNKVLPDYFFDIKNIKSAIEQAKNVEKSEIANNPNYQYPTNTLGSQIYQVIEAFLEFKPTN